MRKNILIWGIVLLIGGFIINFLAGATLPGNVTIPLIYGSNQTFWLFISVIGLITGIVGLILKKRQK